MKRIRALCGHEEYATRVEGHGLAARSPHALIHVGHGATGNRHAEWGSSVAAGAGSAPGTEWGRRGSGPRPGDIPIVHCHGGARTLATLAGAQPLHCREPRHRSCRAPLHASGRPGRPRSSPRYQRMGRVQALQCSRQVRAISENVSKLGARSLGDARDGHPPTPKSALSPRSPLEVVGGMSLRAEQTVGKCAVLVDRIK